MNSRYGTKVAVLAGDYLFAQSSYYLAHLDNLEVLSFTQLNIIEYVANTDSKEID